jgi:deoxyribonuclease V
MKQLIPLIKHPWDISEKDAILLQRNLSGKVIKEDRFEEVKWIAGVDVAYDEQRNEQFAAAVVLDALSFEVIEFSIAQEAVKFPYIPGLFSFREIPTIAKALMKLKTVPDLIVCDGQGVAHPRRFGLACHLGVIFDIPSIGCGKTRLLGTADDPGSNRGDSSPLIDNGETVGCVLRTQTKIRPIFVSVGHLVSLKTACDWIIKLTPKFRLPETTRQADQLVKKLKKGDLTAASINVARL